MFARLHHLINDSVRVITTRLAQQRNAADQPDLELGIWLFTSQARHDGVCPCPLTQDMKGQRLHAPTQGARRFSQYRIGVAPVAHGLYGLRDPWELF